MVAVKPSHHDVLNLDVVLIPDVMSGEKADSNKYCEIIEPLLEIAGASRPIISMSICKLSQYLGSPS